MNNLLFKISIILVSLCTSMSLMSCKDEEDNKKPIEEPWIPVAIDIIEEWKSGDGRYNSGTRPGEELTIVIKDSIEWESLLKFYASNSQLVPVDFSVNQVIAVIVSCGTGGYSIDITEVIEYRDKIIVYYAYLNLPDFSNPVPGPAVATYPYHIAVIPATNKNIFFEYNGEKWWE